MICKRKTISVVQCDSKFSLKFEKKNCQNLKLKLKNISIELIVDLFLSCIDVHVILATGR